MHRRPLGCLTGTALITAFVVTLLVLAAAAATGNGIFSPGRLNAVAAHGPLGGVASHAELETRCAACHPAAWSGARMADLCLACHTSVGVEIASGGGLHGRLAMTDGCRACHTDHRGAEASLTLANPSGFAHERTGFALAAHKLRDGGGTFGCRDCHTASLVTFSAQTCLSCHQARDPVRMTPHLEAFGPTCLTCHDGVDTYGKAFDHHTYPLVGGHAQASCAACHPGATDPAALRAAPTQCIACHAGKDVHEGRLGTSCGDCHTPAAWTDARIDHNLTRFVLVGAHVSVVCLQCHVGHQWTGIATSCRACHAAADPHQGQFSGDCAQCHVATGWKDVTFDHGTTAFALTGSHTTTACAACHTGGKYKGTPATCIGCHAAKDKHNGAYGTNCAACHRTTAWSDWTFDHSTAAFKLTGAHVTVACTACHKGGQYKGTPTTCIACHAANDRHNGSFGTNCAACHTTASWTGATFDHNTTAFKLTGAHATPACSACHPGGLFKGTPSTCYACHANKDKHKGAYGTNCASCHRATTWADVTFNHSQTRFKLTGAHLGVTCRKCHTSPVFQNAPTICAACHQKPASHGSAFSGSCSACHTTKAWQPASFNGPHPFPMSHGGAGGLCAKCHPSSWLSYSCTSCHSAASMADRHSQVSGYSLTTCAKCHPTGSGGG